MKAIRLASSKKLTVSPVPAKKREEATMRMGETEKIYSLYTNAIKQTFKEEVDVKSKTKQKLEGIKKRKKILSKLDQLSKMNGKAQKSLLDKIMAINNLSENPKERRDSEKGLLNNTKSHCKVHKNLSISYQRSRLHKT
jgi:hypothetical protein